MEHGPPPLSSPFVVQKKAKLGENKTTSSFWILTPLLDNAWKKGVFFWWLSLIYARKSLVRFCYVYLFWSALHCSQWDYWGKHYHNDCLYDIMSLLGLNLGYLVKCNPLPSGVPSGFAHRNFFSQRVNRIYPLSCPNTESDTVLYIKYFLTIEYWNQILQYFLGVRGILHSTLPRESTDYLSMRIISQELA